MLQTYTENCHCGALKFEVDLDLTQSSCPCNCSVRRRTRFWPAVVRQGGFRILVGGDRLTQYRYGRHRNLHAFCRDRSARAFGVVNETPIGKIYRVNLGCIDQLADRVLYELKISYACGLHDSFEAPQHSRHL